VLVASLKEGKNCPERQPVYGSWFADNAGRGRNRELVYRRPPLVERKKKKKKKKKENAKPTAPAKGEVGHFRVPTIAARLAVVLARKKKEKTSRPSN